MVFLGLFIVLPLLEIFTFIAVIDEIGFIRTFLLCILSAVAGIMLAQKQGFDTLVRARRDVDTGHFPAQELFDGLCLFIAGGLLVIPGFISDAMAFALLIPQVRAWLKNYAISHMDVQVRAAGYSYSEPRYDNGNVLEGTYERVDDEDSPGKIDHRP